jgi:excisionase family DNA binding protein
VVGINDAEMLLGIPEHTTDLPGHGRPSFTDLFVLANSRDGLITIAVEGKVSEPFGEVVDTWLHRDANIANRQARLDGLCKILQLNVSDALDLRYQLLHRTASALIEAERFSASTAVMLVHSFSSDSEWLDDYIKFAKALGVTADSSEIVDAGMRSGKRLLLGWLTSPVGSDSAPTSSDAQSPRLLDVQQVSDLLNISRTSVYDLISTGELESIKIGRSRRILSEDLELFIQSLKAEQSESSQA